MADLGMKNGGIRKTMTALTMAWSWAMAWASLGHEPTMEEYADWWNQSLASAYRELDAWRACYPDETVSVFVTRAGLLKSFEEAMAAWKAVGEEAGSPAKRLKAFEPLLAGLMTVDAPRF